METIMILLVVVIIMTEYIVRHVLKDTTYHYLFLKITCGIIQGFTTIKTNHKNKVICIQTVMHCSTIQRCATNQVNTVDIFMKKIFLM